MTIKESVNELIQSFQERQGTSKKLIRTLDFEEQVIARLGNPRRYNELGGYREFCKIINLLKKEGKLKNVAKPKPNLKNPSLDVSYWLLPIYNENSWNNEDIARVLRYVDLSFYMKNKKYQTNAEWQMVERIYQFMLVKDKCRIINREERSQMLFNNISLPKNIEAEKFLSTSEGVAFMNRLKLTEKELCCKVVREPFEFWENARALDQHEVLIVEGLPTYNTIKEILLKGFPWIFGPLPYFLIWGEGYRIESTINYLHEITSDVKELKIRYLGDMDYEGFNIYFNLKRKNKDLNIILAHSLYEFLSKHVANFSAKVHKDQRVIYEVLDFLRGELQNNEDVLNIVEILWKEKKRIAQETINLETIFNEGVL